MTTPVGFGLSYLMELSRIGVRELLNRHAEVLEELRTREVIRSTNNPLGDYAEYLFCRAFGWKRLDNSTKGADAEDEDGTRYQIKSRRLTGPHYSRQLSALRELDKRNFDFLAAALFREDFSVLRAALVPHQLIMDNSKHTDWTSSWRFELRDEVWTWEGVRDATSALLKVQD